MYRKIIPFLESWKESRHRKPLILQGARQVGKTCSLLEFGRKHYENVAYFNFETNPKLNKTFEENKGLYIDSSHTGYNSCKLPQRHEQVQQPE